MYAQPTFGHLKKTDLLILGSQGRSLAVEVKSKQDSQWPACKGICDTNHILIFVDFAKKLEFDRPDFYILTHQDWKDLVDDFVKKSKEKNPDINVVIDGDYVPVWVDQIGKTNNYFKGVSVKIDNIITHKEKWEKITQII